MDLVLVVVLRREGIVAVALLPAPRSHVRSPRTTSGSPGTNGLVDRVEPATARKDQKRASTLNDIALDVSAERKTRSWALRETP